MQFDRLPYLRAETEMRSPVRDARLGNRLAYIDIITYYYCLSAPPKPFTRGESRRIATRAQRVPPAYTHNKHNNRTGRGRRTRMKKTNCLITSSVVRDKIVYRSIESNEVL